VSWFKNLYQEKLIYFDFLRSFHEKSNYYHTFNTYLAGAGAAYYFLFAKNLNNRIVIPYIAHQQPRIDPHVPSSIPIADKLDEVVFDGIFNVSANPSGIDYEDGLGEFIEIDAKSRVKIRLKPKRKWHSSYSVAMEKNKITISDAQAVEFTAKDLKFTLRRIQKLGSISPDYILVSQAIPDFDFIGPDENDEITFQFRGDRIWTEGVSGSSLLQASSFDSQMESPSYKNGTRTVYRSLQLRKQHFLSPVSGLQCFVPNVILKPFIDNSTYSTEIKNKNINTLLSTPFGSISPIFVETRTSFFTVKYKHLFFLEYCSMLTDYHLNTYCTSALINNKKVMDRFFRIGTEQQRNIAKLPR
jgi:hypothetical protein